MLRTVGVGEHILLLLSAPASYISALSTADITATLGTQYHIGHRLKLNTSNEGIRAFLLCHPKRGARVLALTCVTVYVVGRVELYRCPLVT